ncbi:unnamed protein product [Peniophora sp. CBMAI 1063]|nr:unnamed protein product [Peniophora sp. CBMAI 1063]
MYGCFLVNDSPCAHDELKPKFSIVRRSTASSSRQDQETIVVVSETSPYDPRAYAWQGPSLATKRGHLDNHHVYPTVTHASKKELCRALPSTLPSDASQLRAPVPMLFSRSSRKLHPVDA